MLRRHAWEERQEAWRSGQKELPVQRPCRRVEFGEFQDEPGGQCDWDGVSVRGEWVGKEI